MRRANDTAIAQSFVINKEMYNLKNNSDELDKLAKILLKHCRLNRIFIKEP